MLPRGNCWSGFQLASKLTATYADSEANTANAYGFGRRPGHHSDAPSLPPSASRRNSVSGDNKFREATVQADNKLGEYPDGGLVNVFQARKMNTYLRSELAQGG